MLNPVENVTILEPQSVDFLLSAAEKPGEWLILPVEDNTPDRDAPKMPSRRQLTVPTCDSGPRYNPTMTESADTPA